MIVYIIFVILLFLQMFIDKLINSKKNREKNSFISHSKLTFNLNMKLAILTIILFSSLRYNVGWDYMAYYETIVFERVTNIILNKEYFTIILIQFAKIINIPQLYFIINSIITICLIMSSIKKYSSDFWVSIIFFVTFPLFFLNSLSVVRNFTAIAITFYGFKYIENKKFLKYLITIIIASLFHRSAIIAIVFYFVNNIKFNTIIYVLGLVIAPFASNILNQVILLYFPNYSAYTNVSSSQAGTKAIIVLMFIGIVAILFKRKLSLQSSIFDKFFNLFYFGIFVYLTFIRQGTMGHRLSLYGTIYSLIVLPEIIQLFKKNNDRILIKFIFYIICIAMFFFTVYIGKNTYLPYRTFFTK